MSNTIKAKGQPPAAAQRQDAVVLAYVGSNDVTYSWHQSLTRLRDLDSQLHRRMHPDNGGGFISIRHGTGGLVAGRNQAVHEFLTEFPDAQWLFWLDTDMGFQADALELLLGAADPVERPIVGALCFSLRETEPDGFGGWRTQPMPTIYDWITIAADGEDASGYAARWDYPPNTVTRCHATGSACIVIHRSALERIEAKFGTWYDRVPNPTTSQFLGEDLSFCVRAGALDIPVYVDTRVKTTHSKRVWISEDDYIRDRVILALQEKNRETGDGYKHVPMGVGDAWTFARLPEALDELRIPAKSVLHVGAHHGQEVPIYRKCGFEHIALVEPDPDNAEFLRREVLGVDVVECAAGQQPGRVAFHRAAESVFNGLNPDAGRPTVSTIEVDVRPLRDIQAEHPANVLVVDTQGTELDVLASADLSGVDLVIVETQDLSRAMHAAYWPDVVEMLGKSGFRPAIRWEHEEHFADTLFVRAPVDV